MFTELKISSSDMSTMIMFLLRSTPATPMEKRMKLRIRKWFSVSIIYLRAS
jgi:hypothetical protein